MKPVSAAWRAAWMAAIALCVGVIAAGSLLDVPAVATAGSLDKLGHALSYLALTVLGAGITTPERLWRVPVRCFLLGLLLEAAQELLTEHREADWLDAAANGAGVLAGWLLVRGPRAGWAGQVEAWLARRLRP